MSENLSSPLEQIRPSLVLTVIVEGILKEGLHYCRTLLTELSPIANEKGLAAALSSGTGLLFIRERMKALDGRFDFESVPNQGTTATLVVPIRNLAVPPAA